MSDRDEVIRVQNVSKDFKFTSERADTLKSLFTGLLKRSDKTENDTKIQHALKNVSFEVKQGEFFGIVGRNGSGKSTLLKILAGIYQPNKGKTDIRGRLVPFIELGVGFNPELTGKENVYLNGALLNFSQQEIDRFYDEVVEFAELGPFMDRQLKDYSSGMQVRLAFSMAVRANADILLIDEVLAVGDADFQRKCYDYFNQLKKNKATVVFVTHDMDAVRQYCDRAALIESSEVEMIGKPGKVANEYSKLFIRSAKPDTTDKNQDRYGTFVATFKKARPSKRIYTRDDKKIEIELIVEANQDIDAPGLGVQIQDGAGHHIAGTNSRILGKKLGKIKAGDTYSFRWTVDNIFKDGSYTADVSVTSNSGEMYEMWTGAVTFSVKSTIKTPHLVQPEITLQKTKNQ